MEKVYTFVYTMHLKFTLLRTLFFFALTGFSLTQVRAGDTVRVLFIGNSYIATNNLPQTIAEMAAADGNNLIYNSSTPGGSTLQQHCTNPTTLGLLNQGPWDYVVLQEQSQLPAFPDSLVETKVYPYAQKLDSLVHAYNPCAKTVFFMTWGRKNGDQQNCPAFPPLCTYTGMDSLLQLRYTHMADSAQGYLSPVARVWRSIRTISPNLELYQPDESHPSITGTFIAASCFYALLFNADPQANSYNSVLIPANAALIKTRAKAIVTDSLDYWKRFDSSAGITADFAYTDSAAGTILIFSNLSENATGYYWDFGDGGTSTLENPAHTFAPGTYTVCLRAIADCDSAESCQEITISPTGISGRDTPESWIVYPNPVKHTLYIRGINEEQDYSIYNILGQKLQQGLINTDIPAIRLPALPQGVYFIRLKDKEGRQKTARFLKQPE